MTLNETKAFTNWAVGHVLKGLLIFLAITIVVPLFPIGRDSTDAEWPLRSGMKLHVDNLTGCQYLATTGGGITPRLSPQGQHFGCKQPKEH